MYQHERRLCAQYCSYSPLSITIGLELLVAVAHNFTKKIRHLALGQKENIVSSRGNSLCSLRPRVGYVWSTNGLRNLWEHQVVNGRLGSNESRCFYGSNLSLS